MARLIKKTIHWWQLGKDAQLKDNIGNENFVKQGSPSFVSVNKFDNALYTNAAADYARKTSFTIDYNKLVCSGVLNLDYNVINGVTSDGQNHNIKFCATDANNFAYFGGGNPNLLLELRISGIFYRFQFTTGVNITSGTDTSFLLIFDRTEIDGGSDTCRLYIGTSLVFNSSLAVPNQSNTSCTMNIISNQGISQPLNGSLNNLKMYNDSSGETITQINRNDDFESFKIDNQVTIV
jgi:hypothetical protein